MNILGISCFYHDSAACLICDGILITAVQEERFTRVKGDQSFPVNAVNYCLAKAGFTISDIDQVVFYEKPFLKFLRVVVEHLKSYPFSLRNFLSTMPSWLDDRLAFQYVCKNKINYSGSVLFLPHHLAHASSAFFPSPFEEAAILTVDGVGEFATASFGYGNGCAVNILKGMNYPNSLGLIYTAITTYLGFSALTGEGKVMAMAGYGKPTYLDKIKRIVDVKKDGSFNLDSGYFIFNKGAAMYSRRFIKLFGVPRNRDAPITERHFDIASSLQTFFQDVIIKMANHVYEQVGIDKLALAGGVFLNCVVNTEILEQTEFKEIYVHPAAGDSGGALGAAAYGSTFLEKKRCVCPQGRVDFGPEFTNNRIKSFLLKEKIDFKEFDNRTLVQFIAQKLSQSKIVGWFQGAMEWGPRALGNRSILADPRNPMMKDILNRQVKHREYFRPYGVSILKEDVSDFFDLPAPSPFMLLVARVKKQKAGFIPCALHVDGTSRIQTISYDDHGIFYDLIREFKSITGIPMVINTSFNDENEPVVCSPQDAYGCFINTRMDYLVLGGFVIEKKPL